MVPTLEERAQILAIAIPARCMPEMLAHVQELEKRYPGGIMKMRVEVVRLAMKMQDEDRSKPARPLLGLAPSGRGAVWTDVTPAGLDENRKFLWRVSVSIYLGSEGWSIAQQAEGMIEEMCRWAKGRARELRGALALKLAIQRHAGAERGVRSTPARRMMIDLREVVCA